MASVAFFDERREDEGVPLPSRHVRSSIVRHLPTILYQTGVGSSQQRSDLAIKLSPAVCKSLTAARASGSLAESIHVALRRSDLRELEVFVAADNTEDGLQGSMQGLRIPQRTFALTLSGDLLHVKVHRKELPVSKTFGNTPFVLAVYLATTSSTPELLVSSPFKVHSKQPKSDAPKAAPKRQRAPPPCRPFPAPATGAEAQINSLLSGFAAAGSAMKAKAAAGGASAAGLGVHSDSKSPCPPPSALFGGESGKESEDGDLRGEERYGSKEAEFELPVPLKRRRGLLGGVGGSDVEAKEDVGEGKCGGSAGLVPPAPLMPPMGSMLMSTGGARAGASAGTPSTGIPSPYLAATFGLPSTPSFALSAAALSSAAAPPPPPPCASSAVGLPCGKTKAVTLSERMFQASPSLSPSMSSGGSTATTGTTGTTTGTEGPSPCEFPDLDFLDYGDFELLEACGSF